LTFFTVIQMEMIRRNDLKNNFAALLIELDDLRGDLLAIVKREDTEITLFSFVQPLRKFSVRHLVKQYSKQDEMFATQEC